MTEAVYPRHEQAFEQGSYAFDTFTSALAGVAREGAGLRGGAVGVVHASVGGEAPRGDGDRQVALDLEPQEVFDRPEEDAPAAEGDDQDQHGERQTDQLRLRRIHHGEVLATGEHLEAVLDLGWKGAGAGFQAEGLVFRPDGSIVKAINPRNAWIPVELDEDGRFEVYVEAAANPEIISGGFFPQPRGERRPLRVERCWWISSRPISSTGGVSTGISNN